MNSFWNENTDCKEYPKLEKDIDTDICIIGGGITGISIAYQLLNKGWHLKNKKSGTKDGAVFSFL